MPAERTIIGEFQRSPKTGPPFSDKRVPAFAPTDFRSHRMNLLLRKSAENGSTNPQTVNDSPNLGDFPSNGQRSYGGTSDQRADVSPTLPLVNGSVPKMSESSQRSVGNGGFAGGWSAREPLLFDGMPMSKDRRKFIIISVFDSVLTTMLWLLSTVTRGNDWPTIFFQEVNIFEPNFLKVSLFDIVICGVLRTTALLICYAGLRLEHWIPVALTTTISTLYIILKILFFFNKDNGALPQYLVILAAFSVAWFELWLVPFKMLPGERRGDFSASSSDEGSGSGHANEGATRRPTSSFSRFRRVNGRRRMAPVTTEDEFRSALEYTTDEERNPPMPTSLHITLPAFGVIPRQLALRTLDEASRDALRMYDELCTWKLMRSDPEIRNSGNIFYLKAEFACEPRVLHLAGWRDNELWNPQLVKMDYLVKLDSETDIVHSESSPALGGYVNARHFVDIRRVHHDTQHNTYTGIFVSIPTVCRPDEVAGGVRGLNGPNLVRISPSATSPGKSIFEWIMNTDVKTQIPKTLMRRGTVSFLANYPSILAKFISERVDFYAVLAEEGAAE